MRRSLLTLMLWLCGGLCARADDRVLLLQHEGLRPGLCAALRIQLADAARVTCERERPSAMLSERLAHAAERVKDEEARVGLLLERDPDPRLVRMYIVAAQEDQAVVTIERIEDRPEPDVDRSLALKVRDAYFVIEQVTERPATPLAAVVAPAPPPATGLTEPEVAPPPSAGAGYEVWLDVGGGLSMGGVTRGAFAGALGVARSRGALRWELGAGARFLGEYARESLWGRVSEVERGPQLALRALYAGKRFLVGGALEPVYWLSRASGTAANGQQGKDRQTFVSIFLSLDLRVKLLPSAALRYAPGLEWISTHQRYAVDDEVVMDLGQLRFVLPLSLTVSLPLGVAEGAP